MNPTIPTNQFSLIFDQIYNEKHAQFSQMITKWHQDKEEILTNSYKQSIGRMFEDIESEHKMFERRITELLRVANAEYQIFSKVKSLNYQQKQQSTRTLTITSPPSTNLPPSQTQLFHTTMNKIHKKSTCIQQMSEFASRFFAITSTQLNEFKSMTSQIQNRRERYVFDYKKQSVEDSRVLGELCLKSESKYFRVRLLERLRQCFQREVKILCKVNSEVRVCYGGSLNKRKQILQNCIDNMTKYQQLLVKVFCDNLIGDVRKHFDVLVAEIERLIEENESKQKEYIQVKEQVDKECQGLYQDNVQIFNFIMEDITLGEWRVTLEVVKKSSFGSFSPMSFGSNHNSLKVDPMPDDSNKQFSIPVTDKSVPLSQSQQGQMILTLTIDYKLLIRKLSQKNKIVRQYLLNDLRQKSQNQKKKVFDVRKLAFKDKSSKQKIEICFVDADKRDQFLLHIERYEQLRDTLGK